MNQRSHENPFNYVVPTVPLNIGCRVQDLDWILRITQSAEQ